MSGLSPDQVKSALKEEAAAVESYLQTVLRHPGTPKGLRDAMEYSLLAGGKRIRPVLCLVSAKLFGLEARQALPFAAAIECIHTYSLIHDDLPAMDDDDLRRGRPSCHKQFDEATAILAGDSLLTDAFFLMAQCASHGIPAERVLRAVSLAAEAAGSPGMAGGQFLDMQYTARDGVTLDELAAMHAMKTGALIRMACEAGAVLAGAEQEDCHALREYGTAVGAAFQVTDDILDETGAEEDLGKPVGSDLEQGKTTYPSLLGLEQSKQRAKDFADRGILALAPYSGFSAELLRGLAVYIVNRTN